MGRKRKARSKRQRFEVFKRDGFACQYCGRKPPEVILEADHIVALSNGGYDHESNMITACCDCNRGKADVPLEQIPEALAKQIQDKRDRAAQAQAFNDFLMEIREREQRTVNDLSVYWCDHMYPESEKGKWTFVAERKASIHTFLRSLTAAEILEAMDIAISRMPIQGRYDHKTFKYFCGVCWRMIKEGRDAPRS